MVAGPAACLKIFFSSENITAFCSHCNSVSEASSKLGTDPDQISSKFDAYIKLKKKRKKSNALNHFNKIRWNSEYFPQQKRDIQLRLQMILTG